MKYLILWCGFIATIILSVLKMAGMIDWTWSSVLLPAILNISIGLAVAGLLLNVMFLRWLYTRLFRKKEVVWEVIFLDMEGNKLGMALGRKQV